MFFTFWKEKSRSQRLSKLTLSWPGRATILFSLWTPCGPHRIIPLALKTSSVTFWGLLSVTVNYCIQCKSPLELTEISVNMELFKSGIDGDFEDKVNCVFLLTK